MSYHDQIEALLPNGGELYDVRDVASKTADNAARLAALFHVFSGHTGPIGLATMEAAARVASWHLNEARRFLGELALPEDLANPIRLETYLVDHCRRIGTDRVTTREIQQYGPGALRNKQTAQAAVAELEEMGRARTLTEGRKRFFQVRAEVLGGAL